MKMGKLPQYTDSDETEDPGSSVENFKKKKKFSILKSTAGGTVKKKKCKTHSLSEPDDSEYRSRASNQRVPVRKLRGILKHDRSREFSGSDEEEDLDEPEPKPRDKYLVGRVPRPAGSRPGRGGGLAILIRKNAAMTAMQSLQAQSSISSTKRRKITKRLSRKRSY